MAERDIQAEMPAEAEAAGEKAAECCADMECCENIRHAVENLKEKGKKSVEAVEHQVGEHPFISLIAAFGAGFLVSKIMDRK